MTDSLTTRMIALTDLPNQVERFRNLSYLLRQTAQQAKQVEWYLNTALDDLKLVLRRAGIPIDAVETKRHETRFDVKLLTLAELQNELGISRGTLIKVRKNPSFPKPVRISGRRLAYLSREVEEWVNAGGLRTDRETVAGGSADQLSAGPCHATHQRHMSDTPAAPGVSFSDTSGCQT